MAVSRFDRRALRAVKILTSGNARMRSRIFLAWGYYLLPLDLTRELHSSQRRPRVARTMIMKTENRISSAVSDISSEAAERFDDVQSNVTETVARISRDTGKFIRERPWTAVAIVAAVGIAIGLLAKSRD